MTRVQAEGVGKRKPWQFMSRFIIQTSESGVYLNRLRLIQTPYFGIMLHKFLRPDSDPFVHDHPWSFVSLVLRGGYTEVRRVNHTHALVRHHVKRFNVMRRDDAHYICELDRVPTWTLVIHGRRRRTWGFYVPTVDLIGHALGEDPNMVPNQTWVEFENWEQFKLNTGISGPRPKVVPEPRSTVRPARP